MTDNRHSVTVEERKRVFMTGLSEVESFSESKIVAVVSGKDRITVLGSNMKISVFQKETGNLRVDGEIRQIVYSAGKLSAVGKIFK